MHKHAMAKLTETLCEQIVARSDGTIDQSGARALLGMSLRKLTPLVLAAALPNGTPPELPPEIASLVSKANSGSALAS
jgi:hypothetical protein